MVCVSGVDYVGGVLVGCLYVGDYVVVVGCCVRFSGCGLSGSCTTLLLVWYWSQYV